MEDRDLRREHLASDDGKEPYEPPEAQIVRVEVEARVAGCNFTTFQVCGLTE
jgi:hypothetical protein